MMRRSKKIPFCCHTGRGDKNVFIAIGELLLSYPALASKLSLILPIKSISIIF